MDIADIFFCYGSSFLDEFLWALYVYIVYIVYIVYNSKYPTGYNMSTQRGEEVEPQQYFFRATFSSFSRPSHLEILVLPTDRDTYL